MSRRVLLGTLAIAVALLATPASRAEPEKQEALKVGDAAPTFSMQTVNPDLAKLRLLALARHVGASPAEPRKAVVLSFSASYCEPCKRELAEIGRLEPRLSKAGIMLAVVIVDTEQPGIEQMKKLTVEELKLPYPVLSDRFGVLARRYHAGALPYVVVIDEAGSVRWVHSGFTKDALQELTQKLGV